MSSETSTDTLAPHRARVRGAEPALAPWQLFTLAGLIGATVVVFVSRGQAPAGIVLLSLTIFTAAIVGVAAWRTLTPFTGSDDRRGPPVLGGRTRAALEREKMLALRSIKDLEFDRAMGKVSEKDFAEMSARLRSRAARLIGEIDSGAGYRDQIEQEIVRRVGARPKRQDPTSVDPQRRTCPACSKDNDRDARFCKHCGAGLEAAQ